MNLLGKSPKKDQIIEMNMAESFFGWVDSLQHLEKECALIKAIYSTCKTKIQNS